MIHERVWWRLVFLFCLIPISIIIFFWYREVATYTTHSKQLSTPAQVDSFLSSTEKPASPSRRYIPTGVYIQSLKFTSASDVNITGYIWQKYAPDVPDSSRGFVFPEQVFSNNTLVSEAYRHMEGDVEVKVKGWFFDVTLRQPFNYSKYPLDQQDIWVLLWYKEFDKDVVLTPDLESYTLGATAPGRAFGLDTEIVPGGWVIDETYFYHQSNCAKVFAKDLLAI